MAASWADMGIDKQQTQIVGVSGGPDSMALLHILKKSGFNKLVVAHVDHGIRAESYADAQMVAAFAKEMRCKFELQQIDLPKKAQETKSNLEALGREVRYEFFRDLKKQHNAQYVVTAHHADDQLETVLMNILRGCGLEGLKGISQLDGDLWRPLLSLSKEEINSYCRENKIRYVLESSNNDITFRRNYLRHKVVPHLKSLNPNLLTTMQKNLKVWGMAADYFQEKAQTFLKNNTLPEEQQSYALAPFLELPELEQQSVLRQLYQNTHGNKTNLIQEHLDQILKVLRQKNSNKKKEFGPDKMLLKKREYFQILDTSLD